MTRQKATKTPRATSAKAFNKIYENSLLFSSDKVIRNRKDWVFTEKFLREMDARRWGQPTVLGGVRK